VAKHKNKKSLYEALNRQNEKQGSVNIPEWMRSSQIDRNKDVSDPDKELFPENETVPTDHQPVETSADSAEEHDTAVVSKVPAEPGITSKLIALLKPSLRKNGTVVEIRIDYVGAMFAAGLMMVMLVLAFTLGWFAASPGPESNVTIATTSTNKPTLPNNPLGNSQKGSTGGKNTIHPGNDKGILATADVNGDGCKDRDENLQYLIIQTMLGQDQKDREEARKIIDFLESKGVHADGRYAHRGRILVWSLRGFKDKNSPSARRYKEKIEKLGEEYFRKHQKYKFKGGVYINGV